MRNKIVIIIISFAFVILFWTKVYDNRTLKTSAENLIQRIETTCGKDFMNYIDYVEGMRQPREFRESKNASEFTIKLVVKKSCEDKVFDVIRRTTAISYDKMSDIQKDSKNIINNTIVFSINGQCEDVLGKNILFNSTIYKNGNRNYSPLDIELYGVKQENDKMVIYCTTHAKRDKLAWKIFDYLYCFGYGNVNHFAVFSLMMIIGIILSIVLVYVIKNHFIIRGKLNNAANIRKVLLFCVVIVFVGIAFFLNMIMNFPMLIRNSNFYNFRPNCVEASHTGIWKLIKYASYCKVTNGELIRSFIEMLSFVPIGMLLFEVFKKNRTIKSIVFVTSVSVLFELFGDWGYISHYYYQTLFYNILGGLTGLGIISLFAGIRKGTIIRKRDKMISCMPIALDIILFSFFIILGNTSLLGNVYPNYYCKINTDNLNVKLVNEECMKKNRSLYNVLAENQYDLYKNQYNLNINADVDEDCQELHCYYNDTEIENMLNRIGIAYYLLFSTLNDAPFFTLNGTVSA